jgi:DNA-binding NarL/FixJ family response regulator
MYDTILLVTTPYNLQHLVNNKHLLLSDIEKDIFFFLSKGLNTRQIAERLFRLHRTVENIIYNLKEKFQKTKGELIYLYNQQFL